MKVIGDPPPYSRNLRLPPSVVQHSKTLYFYGKDIIEESNYETSTSRWMRNCGFNNSH